MRFIIFKALYLLVLVKMNLVGEYIRKKRISKKLSLNTVCDELKISKYI